MLRYLFDEHVHGAIAPQLQLHGIDVLTAADAAIAGREVTDVELLRFASQQGRVLVTQDRDFIRLATTQAPHAGIILVQRRLSIGQYVEYLDLMARVVEPDEMRDRLVFCDW